LHRPRKPITCLDLVMKVMTRLFNSLSSQIKLSRVATETLKADKKIKEKQTVLIRREGKFLRRLSWPHFKILWWKFSSKRITSNFYKSAKAKFKLHQTL
jgi:hypothetical protein